MDSEACAVGSKGVELTEKSSEVFEPFTPDCSKEKTTLAGLNSPPSLISNSSPQKAEDCVDSCIGIVSPCTPKQHVFDPFAPGCEDLALAPLVKKSLARSLTSIARQLDFDSALGASPSGNVVGRDSDAGGRCKDASSSSLSEELLESIYGSLLEAIVKKQAEEVIFAKQTAEEMVAESVTPMEESPILGKQSEDVVASVSLMEESECEDDLKTPPSTPLLNGVAEICPNAPVKAAASWKPRNIDSSLCRKLEF